MFPPTRTHFRRPHAEARTASLSTLRSGKWPVACIQPDLLRHLLDVAWLPKLILNKPSRQEALDA